MTRAAIIFDVFLPHHLARLRSAAAAADVVGVEIAGASCDYAWATSLGDGSTRILFPDHSSACIPPGMLRERLFAELEGIAPDVVFVPGWSARAALFALAWCGRHRRTAVMMCDSTELDAPRSRTKELLKRALLSGCAAAFVSGARSARYVRTLGMPEDKVCMGYDAIDTRHFADGAARARMQPAAVRARWRLPEAFLLCVCRLLPKKNVDGLLRGYQVFRAMHARGPDLVIAGAGPEEAALRSLTQKLRLEGSVHFLGHVGYDALPDLYGAAHALVLASAIEPWGLVINEAAAAGLPLLVSDRCGAGEDLLEPGRSGWRFDPGTPQQIAEAMRALVSHPDHASLSRASTRAAEAWGLARFQEGFMACLAIAAASGRPPSAAVGTLAGAIAVLPRRL